MSRSFKKSLVAKDKNNKYNKKCANKRVRRYDDIISNGKHYKKIYESYDILYTITDFRERTIKMYVGRPSIKNNIRYDYTTLYEIRIKLLNNNSGDCIIKSVSIKDD